MHQPDWHGLSDAYLKDPWPLVATGVFYASDYCLVKNWFVAGQGLILAGAAILTFDLFKNNEAAEALTYGITMGSAAFGTFRSLLAKNFGNARNAIIRNTLGRPNRSTGLLSILAEFPTVVTATGVTAVIGIATKADWALCAAAACWLMGSVTNTLLPEVIPAQPEANTAAVSKTSLKAKP